MKSEVLGVAEQTVRIVFASVFGAIMLGLAIRHRRERPGKVIPREEVFYREEGREGGRVVPSVKAIRRHPRSRAKNRSGEFAHFEVLLAAEA